jgi:hypothetical protein
MSSLWAHFFQSISQFSSGALLFITGGLLVASYLISRRVIVGSGQNRSSSSLRGMAALLTGSYGATMVWFLRSYLRTIFFKYAEFALVSTMYVLFGDVAEIKILTLRSF